MYYYYTVVFLKNLSRPLYNSTNKKLRKYFCTSALGLVLFQIFFASNYLPVYVCVCLSGWVGGGGGNVSVGVYGGWVGARARVCEYVRMYVCVN